MRELKMHKSEQMLLKNIGTERPTFFNKGEGPPERDR